MKFRHAIPARPLAAFAMLAGGTASAQPTPVPPSTFVNWETPQVHPMDLTPDQRRLLVVNTANNSLDVFDVERAHPRLLASIPVGLDPVAVRAADAQTAWVVNQVSDSVSIVDLATMRVVQTIDTDDEPCDVVFAGSPRRAFVSCSQVNLVQVFDLAAPSQPVGSVLINGEDPRAMAVSPDGSSVYVAVFESGNGSTIIGGGSMGVGTIAFPPNAVSDPLGPYAGVNPPPNAGAVFFPSLTAGLPAPLAVGLIVKKDALGRWMDDNNGDWTNLVSGANASRSGRLPGWNLPDRDLAVIDATTLNVNYATRLMNMCMAVGVNPATGVVTMVGTDAINEVRFEPNVNGRFVRVKVANVSPSNLAAPAISDLNTHLTYAAPTIPQSDRNRSVGDPRAVVWNASGTQGFVAGMGSNNVIAIDATGVRSALPAIPVGEGPTGLVLDSTRDRLYVLNRFGGSVSIVSLSTWSEAGRLSLFDPTPTAIKTG
ncbi:MAG: YncE family protein, partial [Phycisphaerales bacterium]